MRRTGSRIPVGAVTWLTDNDHRSAMLITGLFFVLGLVVLTTVDPERGRRAANVAVEANSV